MQTRFYPLFIYCFLSAGNLFAADKPSWINNPDAGCIKSSELCAVGMGTSRDEANRNAKVEISKIFSLNISSKFASSLNSSSEEIQEDLKEETDAILEGVQSKKMYEQKDGFFSLAVLNKREAAEGIKYKITNLDAEIKASSEQKSPNLKRLFIKRQGLNQTYLFLTGAEIPSPIDPQEIFKTNKDLLKDYIVHIYFEEKEPKPFEGLAIKNFSDYGFKVTTGKKIDPSATHIVSGKVIAERLFLNVKGFRKYKVVLKISASNAKKIETGHLNFESVHTGRNYQHAYENAVKEISNELKEKINELNIE